MYFGGWYSGFILKDCVSVPALLLWTTCLKFSNLKSGIERIPFFCVCHPSSWSIYHSVPQLPVFLHCDERLPTPGVNPFFLHPISESIAARSQHHTNPIFLLKSAASIFSCRKQFMQGGSFGNHMSIWPGVWDTFQYFIPEHVCVFSLCIWVVTCLTTQFEKKQYTLIFLGFAPCCLRCEVKVHAAFFLFIYF